MTTRINISLSEEEYEKAVKCYKHFVNNYDWKDRPIPTITGYVASIVMMTINRILEEEKL